MPTMQEIRKRQQIEEMLRQRAETGRAEMGKDPGGETSLLSDLLAKLGLENVDETAGAFAKDPYGIAAEERAAPFQAELQTSTLPSPFIPSPEIEPMGVQSPFGRLGNLGAPEPTGQMLPPRPEAPPPAAMAGPAAAPMMAGPGALPSPAEAPPAGVPPPSFGNVSGGGGSSAPPPGLGGPPSFGNVASGGGAPPPDFSNVLNQASPPPPRPMGGGGAPPPPPAVPASPMTPPQMEVGGPVPDFSGPNPQGDLGAMAMMNASPFAAAGGLQQQATPAMAKQSPFDPTRSTESYMSEAALLKRLEDAQRFARSDSLTAMGAAMLGGEDLLGGLGAAFEAGRGPRQELQKKREELPLQYEKERFERGRLTEADKRDARRLGISEEQLGIAQRQDVRAGEEWDIDKIGKLWGAGQYGEGGIADQMEAIKMEAARLGNASLVAQIEKAQADLQKQNEMLPFEKRESAARSGAYEAETANRRDPRYWEKREGTGTQPRLIEPRDEPAIKARIQSAISEEGRSTHPRGQALILGSEFGLVPEVDEVRVLLERGLTPEAIMAQLPGSENDPDLQEIFAYWKEKRTPEANPLLEQ